MKSRRTHIVTLDLASRWDVLEMVQAVLHHVAQLVEMDDDAAHDVGVALRESVVNAIKHGNRGDEHKRVQVEFLVGTGALEVRVCDEGRGFDPAAVADPVAPENLLKPDGRGIFFMRSFMDEVSYSFPPKGGTIVRMVKALPAEAV
jgi:serine/threonine-protein kinase RsbW